MVEITIINVTTLAKIHTCFERFRGKISLFVMGFLALEECGYFPQFVQDCVEPGTNP